MRRLHSLILAAAAAVCAAGPLAAQANIRITGAGATFPYPIYSKWVLEYTSVRPNIQINYASIGSGGGIRQFSDHTVDFGATDGPMTDSAIAALGGNVLHIPTVLGAVVPIYNIPGVTQQLKFTADVLAGIFLGQITNWNDSRIAAVNPGVTLPNQDLVVVHRSDGSGTTYIWTDYLSKVSPDWLRRVGRGTAVNWPVGLGGQGNPGVAATVSRTPGAIGYVELIYASQNHIAYGTVRNRAGNFIEASLASTTAAAAGGDAVHRRGHRLPHLHHRPGGRGRVPDRVLHLAADPQADDQSRRRRGTLLDFVWWATHDGQRFTQALDYAALPAPVVRLIEARLKTVTLNGSPVLPANYGRGARRVAE